jgi:hypothetical protein
MIDMPREFTAGDSLAFTQSLPAYPAPDWQLSIVLHNATAALAIESDPDGESHAVNEASAITSGWPAGRYDWTAYVTGPQDARATLETGAIIIRPDPAGTSDPLDLRTHARKMLDALEAALEGRATSGQVDTLRTTFGDRNLERDPGKLMELRDKYRMEVRREDQAAALARGERVSHHVKVRFS